MSSQLEKIFVKTAVKTALVILCLVIILFCVFNFGFPQYVATFSENTGNYALAVKYASLRYTYTGDPYDLARCVDDSILSGRDDYIVEYGEKLIADSNYSSVVAYKNAEVLEGAGDYNAFVCGNVAVAKYNLGDFDGALALAKSCNGMQSFKSGNAVMVLAVGVCAAGDALCAQKMLVALDGIVPSDEGEVTLKGEVYSLVQAVADTEN